MSNVKMFCDALPNIPWQEKPASCSAPVWRYTENPVIGRNPLPGVERIFNSAVVPYQGAYIGVFRGEQVNGIPYIYLGRSADGIHWDFDKDKIPFVNEKGEPFMPVYAYDPRLVEIEGTYYIIWCQDFYGASIGMAKTTDFKTFTRSENPFIPVTVDTWVCLYAPFRKYLGSLPAGEPPAAALLRFCKIWERNQRKPYLPQKREPTVFPFIHPPAFLQRRFGASPAPFFLCGICRSG